MSLTDLFLDLKLNLSGFVNIEWLELLITNIIFFNIDRKTDLSENEKSLVIRKKKTASYVPIEAITGPPSKNDKKKIWSSFQPGRTGQMRGRLRLILIETCAEFFGQ